MLAFALHADQDIRQRLRALAARPVHEDRILRAWLQARALDQRTRRQSEHYYPLSLREGLPALQADLEALARIRSVHPGSTDRRGCWSSCRMARRSRACCCRAAASASRPRSAAGRLPVLHDGPGGLLRQISSAEIVAQVVLARSQRLVDKVVFMGMGEPSHNLDNVLEAIELLATHGAIGHKNLVFSTVGDPRAFERLPQGPGQTGACRLAAQ